MERGGSHSPLNKRPVAPLGMPNVVTLTPEATLMLDLGAGSSRESELGREPCRSHDWDARWT
jgi:hypothetical protein